MSSSSSDDSSMVSAASTALSSIWDDVTLKTNTARPVGGHQEGVPSSELVESHPAHADGDTFWSRIVAVAGGLSVNVSKAWEAEDDLPEPETPPGCDSRVTTALKKHYIKQVSDPRQLPAWLFSDIERQVSTRVSQSQKHPSPASPAPPPARVLARHEDAYVQPQRDRVREAAYGEYTGPTRAATRLRALRDARRG